jgi:hypothetical protein
MAKLSNAALKGLIKKPGRHGDGAGLYFRVVDPAKAYWAYRYSVEGKVREMSLGTYPAMSLAEARDRHAAERTKVRTHKRDPLQEKSQARTAAGAVPTFAKAADDYIAAHARSWKNRKHRVPTPSMRESRKPNDAGEKTFDISRSPSR